MTSSAVASQSRRWSSARDLKIVQLKSWFDSKEIVVDESSNSVLKYTTPKFRALATVEVAPLAVGEEIEVGWIQVCTSLQFVNQYGTAGLTSWELPELVSGVHDMISDSDGKRFPWYGSRHEVVHLKGPLAVPTYITVYMHDSFRPQVTWYVPVSPCSTDMTSSRRHQRDPRLSQVRRSQHFLTYLAAIHRGQGHRPCSSSTSIESAGQVQVDVLKTVSWSVQVEIDIDPSRCLGNRVLSIRPVRQRQPVVMEPEESPSLADNALRPPNANRSQTLVWWPSDDDEQGHCDQSSSTRTGRPLPKVVVRPVLTAVTPDVAVKTYLNARSGHIETLRAVVGDFGLESCRIEDNA